MNIALPPSVPHTNAGICKHEECTYLRAHDSDRCSCGGTRHAIASDWGAYSFGHGGGLVGFLTACPKCGKVDKGIILGSEWTPKQLKDADNLIGEFRDVKG